jgi:predicted flap endonuclease-1-like 5' DNA nuclease
MRWPTEYGTVTQGFGARPAYYGKYGLPGHEGLDFTAPEGSRLCAVADGLVSDVRLDGNVDPNRKPYGNQVRIQHEGGYLSVYAHLSQVVVTRGQAVKAGQLVGLAGNTGNSFGAHLHLSLKRAGATVRGETSYPHDLIDPTPHLMPFGDGRPEQPSPPAEATIVVQVESPELGTLNMRQAPYLESELVLRLAHGEVLEALEDADATRGKVGRYGQWLWVRTSAHRDPQDTADRAGYVAAWYLKLPEEEPAPEAEPTVTFVVVESPEGPLSLRSGPDVGAVRIGEMAHGTVLKALGTAAEVRRSVGQHGAWLLVQTPGGETGYAAAWYLRVQGTPVPVVPEPAVGGPTRTVQVESPEYGLKVRKGPGVEHDQVWWIPHETVLESLEDGQATGRKVGQEDTWIHVRTPAMWEGYVAAWYVKAPAKDARQRATQEDLPRGISPHIQGIHLATLGEDPHTRGPIRGLFESQDKKGWIFFTEVCGRDPGGLGPNDAMRSRLWDWANQGYGVIVRLNHGYEPSGTLPRREHYDAFAAAAARWVDLYLKHPELGARAYSWTIQIGNEQNNPREHPGGWDDPEEHITAEMYAEAFNKTYARIKAVLPNAIVCPGAVDPYNYMPMKLMGNANWRPLDYFATMLDHIDALDGVVLHAYLHGPDPTRVTSLARFGGGSGPLHDHYYDFQIYRLFMERIPAKWRDLPVHITEINHICRPPAAPDCNNPDEMGWVEGTSEEHRQIVPTIYEEIDRWNQRPHAQQIRCGLLYRWTGDAWAIENRAGILTSFQQALKKDHRWRKQPAAAPSFAVSAFEGEGAAWEPQEERRVVQPDDLKRIRGIGRKSEMVLNALGIRVFEQLAAYEPERLRQLIAETGLRTRYLRAWPEQARLMAESEADEGPARR